MEIANRVAKDNTPIGSGEAGIVTPVPTAVKRSSLPDPEKTRTPVVDKGKFRQKIENTKSEHKEEGVMEPVEKVFSRSDEPEVRGTIVVTIYKNHPYEVEFSGNITGTERDLSIRFIQKEYIAWKSKISKQQEKEIKVKKEAKKRGGRRCQKLAKRTYSL